MNVPTRSGTNTPEGQREWYKLPKDHGERFNWYGHVMRRDEEHILGKVLRMDITEKRKRGQPKKNGKTRAKVT